MTLEQEQRMSVARHLTSIHRNAATHAYDANMAGRNATMNWLLATFTATHSAVLFYAATNRDVFVNFDCAVGILILGSLSTLLAGLANVRLLNENAAMLYLDMIEEVEGREAIKEAKREPERASGVTDALTSWFAIISILCVTIGTSLVLFGLD